MRYRTFLAGLAADVAIVLLAAFAGYAAFGQSLGPSYQPEPSYQVAQGGMMPGPGTVHSTGGGYTGPGDVITFQEYWGLRCYNSAYTGNVADIFDTATGTATETLLTCSAGGTINQTINSLAITCAISCSVKTLYAQTGTGNNMTWTNVASAPTLTVSCTNSKLCMTFASGAVIASGTGFTLGAPASVFAVGKRTGNTTSYSNLASANNTTTYEIGWGNATNRMFMYNGGTELDINGVADSSFHVAVGVFLGTASSSFSVDGSAPVTANVGALIDPSGYQLGASAGSVLVGQATEVGLIAADATSVTASLCSNARAYWGSAGSC